jgi:hypothetical protein
MMMDLTTLKSSFSRLGMDQLFTQQAEKLGLFTLEDVMNADLCLLKKQAAFTFIWYTDLLNLLKDHGLLSKFQQNHIDQL